MKIISDMLKRVWPGRAQRAPQSLATQTLPYSASQDSIFCGGEKVILRRDPPADQVERPGSVALLQPRFETTISEAVVFRNGLKLVQDAAKRTLTITFGLSGMPPVVLKDASMVIAQNMKYISISNRDISQTIYENGTTSILPTRNTVYLKQVTVDATGSVTGIVNYGGKSCHAPAEITPTGSLIGRWSQTVGQTGPREPDARYTPFILHKYLTADLNPKASEVQQT